MIAAGSSTRRWLGYALRDLVHTVAGPSSSSSSSSSAGRGLTPAAFPASTLPPARDLKARLFGWPPPKVERETAWLDGLRGVAAFLVMAYHFHLAWAGPDLEAPYGSSGDLWEPWRLPFLRVWVCSGHTQVSVFFVLSGLVLSWGPLVSIRAGRVRHDKLAQSLSSAVFRRWIRLFLPCFAIGLVCLLEFRWGIIDLMGVDRRPTLFGQLWDYLWACERFANPFRLDRTEMQAIHSYAWTFWTIPYEFAGSLCVFVVLLAIGRIRSYTRRTVVVAAISAYACLSAQWNYWLFTTGILLADYVREAGGFEHLGARPTTGARSSAIWAGVFVLGLYISGLPERSDRYTLSGSSYALLEAWTPAQYGDIEAGRRFWWCWAGILLITSAAHLRPLRRLFALSLIRYLGRVSFMLYLTHRAVQECVGFVLHRRLKMLLGEEVWSEPLQMTGWVVEGWLSNALIYVVMWAVVGTLAVLVAHWCEVLVDAPSTRFARWVDDRFVNGFGPEGGGEHEEGVEEMRLLPT